MTVSHEQLSDFTEAEFLQFVTDIVEVNANTEQEHHAWVVKFEQLVQHPKGNGLIYYPDDCDGDSPEDIVKTVKAWRRSQGLPLFKDS